jgi:choline dehydrogenase-like flavoprotein
LLPDIGGTAGSVLANRLCTALPTKSILLLERGHLNDSFLARTPLLSLAYTRKDAAVVRYDSEPQGGLGGRKMGMLTGRGIGGTSRINNGLYMRCQPEEFMGWGDGWGYEELRGLYDRSEFNVAGSQLGTWKTRVVPTFFASSEMYSL